jgi:putative tryptophan/tyrosine transport system substrate-binding protein
MLPAKRFLTALFLFCLPIASSAGFTAEKPANITMVVWRGCEDACRGFQNYFTNFGLPVNIKTIDVGKDKSKLPSIREQIISEGPDLVITWGTSVSVAILGTYEKFGRESALGAIPAVFMIVADPVGSKIVKSYEKTDRFKITGVRNRVPEKTQLNLMFDYLHPKKLAVLYDPSELNSILNTEKLRKLATEMNYELIVYEYQSDEKGTVDKQQIPAALLEVKQAGADAIYVGSSSFNLVHQDLFVDSATELGLPVFSAYGKMVREAGAIMAVATSYYNVGKLAATQASDILFEGAVPGAMEVKSLDRFTLFINMKTARKVGIYPPLSVLKVADIIQ